MPLLIYRMGIFCVYRVYGLIIAFMFLAVGVAANTVRDVANPFFTVFPHHFLLVVAVVTGVTARIVARMAGGTVAIGPFMVDGEGVIESGPGKGSCVVAG